MRHSYKSRKAREERDDDMESSTDSVATSCIDALGSRRYQSFLVGSYDLGLVELETGLCWSIWSMTE